MLNDVKLLKFTNGEYILAQVVGYNDGVYAIKNPVTPHLTAVQGGAQLSFINWPAMSEDSTDVTLEVNESNLLVKPVNPISELSKAYNEKFGSGLILATNNLFRG